MKNICSYFMEKCTWKTVLLRCVVVPLYLSVIRSFHPFFFLNNNWNTEVAMSILVKRLLLHHKDVTNDICWSVLAFFYRSMRQALPIHTNSSIKIFYIYIIHLYLYPPLLGMSVCTYVKHNEKVVTYCWIRAMGRAEERWCNRPTFYLLVCVDLVRIGNNGGKQKGVRPRNARSTGQWRWEETENLINFEGSRGVRQKRQ